MHVDVWNRGGASFEYAHFTDRQIALAIDGLDRRSRRPTLEKLVELVRKLRERHGNLEMLLHGTSKPDLAEALWPVLETKIGRALERGTERRIPIVRVLDRAINLAHEIRRSNVVIPIDKH